HSNLNLTIEGVGKDATINGFGMLIRNCANVEIRNLGIMNFLDDGISIDTDNKNIWIHNNDFFYGQKGSASDQAKGDGSLDTKAYL
ncbi:MAG: pectate lyase, partial [Peptococcaceae bacterium]|nr:pectate lyase [Peptococcaceae bacterium]